MRTKLTILLLAFLTLTCTEEIIPTPYTYTKVFTGENNKTWKILFLEETLDGDVIDTFTLGCAEDDKYIFYNNEEHTFEVITGGDKCSGPDEPAKIFDTWTFSNATATVTMLLPFFDPEFAYPFIVREVRNDKLEIEIFFSNNTGSYRIHFDATDED